MPPPPHGLLEGQGRDGLVAASGGSRFVRHYAFVDDDPTWYAVPGAVGFSGSSLSGHLSWTLVGDGAGVARLLQRLAEADGTTRSTFSLSLPVHLEPPLHQHFRVDKLSGGSGDRRDLAGGRVVGKQLGRRNVSGDPSGLAASRLST